MNRHLIHGNQRGAVLVTVALFLLLLLGFTAIGVEAGRWYLIRAELSKSVDAGALAGARNLSNPNVDPRELAREFAVENFPSGYLGTPGSGGGTAAFDVQMSDAGRVSVRGTTDGGSVFGQLAGLDQVPVSSSGVAQKQEVEIMLVLDRSGSMSGTPISDLKDAASSFVDFFSETEDSDRMGLVSFATSVTVARPLGTNFVAPVKASIAAMNAVGATNAEGGLDVADGPSGLTDQSAVPAERRRQQFVIFFSDGRPTAFRGRFRNRSTWYDAVGCVTGNCGANEIGNSTQTYRDLGRPDREAWFGVDPRTTGDGLAAGSACGVGTSTKWEVLEQFPVPGFAPDACRIPYQTELARHVCNLASALAIEHAREMKDQRVTIYAIGLGNANPAFLEQVASSPGHVYYTPNSAELKAIFQKVAMEIKLRLVQ